MQKIENVASFLARDEAGETVTISQYQVFTGLQPVAGAERWKPGTSSFKTEFGESVNHIGGDEYKTVMTEKILRRIR